MTEGRGPLVSGRMCNKCNGHRTCTDSGCKCTDCRKDTIGNNRGETILLKVFMASMFVFGFFIIMDKLFRFSI